MLKFAASGPIKLAAMPESVVVPGFLTVKVRATKAGCTAGPKLIELAPSTKTVAAGCSTLISGPTAVPVRVMS